MHRGRLLAIVCAGAVGAAVAIIVPLLASSSSSPSLTATLRGCGCPVTSVAFSPSGAMLASAESSGRTYLWRIG